MGFFHVLLWNLPLQPGKKSFFFRSWTSKAVHWTTSAIILFSYKLIVSIERFSIDFFPLNVFSLNVWSLNVWSLKVLSLNIFSLNVCSLAVFPVNVSNWTLFHWTFILIHPKPRFTFPQISGAIATYLVIFLQFRHNEEVNAVNPTTPT